MCCGSLPELRVQVCREHTWISGLTDDPPAQVQEPIAGIKWWTLLPSEVWEQ
ncbi:hypothetical protein BCR44DRAFT_38246 [Catenaria anguillulae PL171]|uniref:Uncharacterized protein n=1 Tax=Catenaria anguillulae PL171 TaxID=765915 RepID=A0A1Y2H8F2_9FUNG|nr:hypothetical protein BCR44DRAFT_1452123 [Catenaria anguillulae PL171]ORZ32872.1 hypothetical protein BCR44DRAFT_1439445 [Catenaria anguillulae PL171]ORZ32874.1 hypothetical protein BCR44DRAFT_38246 [Catenaria anguillulae PL171]